MLLKFRVVFDMYIQPHHPGNPENINEIDGDKYAKGAHGCPNTQAEQPVENCHKNEGKEGRPDIGNEHGPVVVTRFGFVVKVADRATLAHVCAFYERPTARFKRVGFLATRAFDKENTMGFGAFLQESSHKTGEFFAKVRYLAVCAVYVPIIRLISAAGTTPLWRQTGSPLWKRIMVGMDCT